MADGERRKLNQQELDFISEYENFEDSYKAVFRAVGHGNSDIADITDDNNQIQRKHIIQEPPAMPKGGLGLMHVKLVQTKDLNAQWEAVASTLEALENTDPMIDSNMKRAIGNFYQHGKYCEFLLGMYTVEEKPVVDFKRMQGDGFVMDAFYHAMQAGLREKGMIEGDDMEDSGDDNFDDFFYSDEEEDVDLDFLKPGGYLQLKYDPELVNSWINKMQSRHIEDQNHMMGLMAHNSGNEENLSIMVKNGGTELRQLCTSLLEESDHAALARNTAILVRQLSEKIDFDEKFVQALLAALHFWVPNNGRKKMFEITESREATRNLVHTLYNLQSKTSEDIMREKASSLEENDKANVSTYLSSLDTTEETMFVLSILA